MICAYLAVLIWCIDIQEQHVGYTFIFEVQAAAMQVKMFELSKAKLWAVF